MRIPKRNIYKAYIRGIEGTTIEYVKRSRMDLLLDCVSSILISINLPEVRV